MVVERAEIAARVRIQTLVHELGYNIALDFERARRNVHEPVEPRVKILFVFRKIRYARHVDRNNADRTRALAASEEPARLFAQFAQVEAQTATHTAYIRRLHVRVDIVGEVRRAVFSRHFKQQAVVLVIRPIEVAGNGIRGYRILESSAVGVALDHDLDKRLIDHVHFLLAILVLEVHGLAADDCGLFREVGRACPVERNIGEWRLRAPARRRVHTVNKRLDALFNLVVRKVVHLDERSEVRVERRKRLRARPFVLHNAEEVDHLIAQRRQMARG